MNVKHSDPKRNCLIMCGDSTALNPKLVKSLASSPDSTGRTNQSFVGCVVHQVALSVNDATGAPDDDECNPGSILHQAHRQAGGVRSSSVRRAELKQAAEAINASLEELERYPVATSEDGGEARVTGSVSNPNATRWTSSFETLKGLLVHRDALDSVSELPGGTGLRLLVHEDTRTL